MGRKQLKECDKRKGLMSKIKSKRIQEEVQGQLDVAFGLGQKRYIVL